MRLLGENMNINSLKYLFFEGLKNVVKNKLMALASVGVLTACLIVVGCSVLLTGNMNNMVTYIGEQSTMVVFLKDGVDQADVDSLTASLKENNSVKEANYISKEQALLNYSKRMNSDSAIKTLSEENVLPASINVHISDMSDLDNLVEISKSSSVVENVVVPTNVTNVIKELGKTVGWFGTAIVLALILVSIVIISNTIRATVFARRREIAIMKQVGATDNFVRFPFLIEGMTIGFVSAVIAFLLICVGYQTVMVILTESSSAFLKSMFSSLMQFSSIGWIMALGFLVSGILAGVIGSLISLRKYLSV